MKAGSLVLVACAAFALPFAAFAQSSDGDYCKKLGTLARLYGSNTGPVPEAVTKCDSDAKGSIATLEKHLQDDKIKLPPR
ncbi:MAG: hypothetical protein ACXWLB_20865 [Reyranella sp.]